MSDLCLHVVVPVHNGSTYVPALIESLLAQSQPPQRIHLVDNGSTDDCWPKDAQLPESIQLRRIPQSLGFGTACNLGMTDALAQGADVVMILNQDLILEPQACERALDSLANHDDIGLLGLFQLSYDGQTLDPPFRCKLPHRLIDDAMLRTLAEIYECEFVPAAAIAIPSHVIKQVGGFDPLYFMYQEDKDLCRRIQRAGHRIGICTTARVRHDCGQHRADKDDCWNQNWYYSRVIYHLKWSSRPLWQAFLTTLKYLLPRWNLRESWWWLKGIAKSASHRAQLRQRRLSDDQLGLPIPPVQQQTTVPTDHRRTSQRSLP